MDPSYTPAQSSDYFFLSLSKMLQGGHLLSWYHEILHAFLSSLESPIRPNQLYETRCVQMVAVHVSFETYARLLWHLNGEKILKSSQLNLAKWSEL